MASEPTVSVRIPQQELDDFGDLMRDLGKETNKSRDKSIEQTARFFLQSAGSRNATPISKTKRPVEANPDRTGRGQGAKGKEWRFKIHSQGKPAFWVYTDNRTDPRRVIKTRGLARNSWKALIAKMPGGRATLTGGSVAQSRARSETVAKILRKPTRLTITTINKVPYLAKITPNVQRDAMRKALNRMNKLLEKARQKQQATWRT